MGSAKADAKSSPVNIRFTRAAIKEMDAYAADFMASHPGMTLRRSDVVRIAVQELLRAAEEKANGKGAK